MNYVYNLGLIHIAKRDFPAAERLFRDALVRFPNSSKLHEGLGQSLCSLFQFPEAEKSFRRALEIEPLNASAQVAVAKLFYSTGDKEKFAQAASRAVELDSGNYQACYYYGLWLSEYQSDQTAATKYFEKSILLYPGFSPALQALGKIRADHEDWERALELYERALSIDSQNRQLYFLASTAYRKLGKAERAEWALRQFKALESNANSSAKDLQRP
jgi:tetratricopeptide (TPR) repeat protein